MNVYSGENYKSLAGKLGKHRNTISNMVNKMLKKESIKNDFGNYTGEFTTKQLAIFNKHYGI